MKSRSGKRGPVPRGGAVRGEKGEQPALDAEGDAGARGGRAISEADVERLAEKALVQVERRGRDAVPADREQQLLLEPLQPLEQLTPARGRAEERIGRLLEPRVERERGRELACALDAARAE